MRVLLFFILVFSSVGFATPRHCRDCSTLPKKEQEFSLKLELRTRKMFCGRFSTKQRDLAMRYARKSHGLTPNEAVIKVMEETGMSLANKRRPEVQKH